MNWKEVYDFSLTLSKPKWGKNKEVDEWIPEVFRPFYKEYDPLEVELPYDGNSLNLIPYKDLGSMLEDYELDKASLVFATCNGDPFFLNDQKVYTCMHGADKTGWELLNDNVEEFFDSIIKADF